MARKSSSSVPKEVGLAAFNRLKPELAALTRRELRPINTDAKRVVATLIEALPRIHADRGELDEVYKKFDWVRFDGLADYAWCLAYTTAEYEAPHPEASNAAETLREAKEL